MKGCCNLICRNLIFLFFCVFFLISTLYKCHLFSNLQPVNRWNVNNNTQDLLDVAGLDKVFCCRTKADQHTMYCIKPSLWVWLGEEQEISRIGNPCFSKVVGQVWCSQHHEILRAQLQGVGTEREKTGSNNTCKLSFPRTKEIRDLNWTDLQWNGDGLTCSLREPWQLFIARVTPV